MAGRPKSGITADTDVNLDFLTKEEREALLSKKMDMIRQRNRMINERHEMIEADRRKAEESGNAVKALDSKTLPAEGAPSKPRGRGRGSHKDGNKPFKDRPKSHGDASSYEPIVDVSDFTVQRLDNRLDNRNKGRGGQHHLDKDGGQMSTPKNRRKPQVKDEAGFRQAPAKPPTVAFDYEPIVDLSDLDHRFGSRPSTLSNHQVSGNGNDRGYNAGHTSGHARSNRRSDPPQDQAKSKPYEGRLKGDGGPPPDPTFNPLVDRRRGGGQEKKEMGGGSDYKRHPRNYGGGADLTKVKDTMKTMREKEKERPAFAKPLDIVMTGRERKNHEQWKQERDKYDNERIQRQLGEGGMWKREWDHDKVVLEYDEHPYSKMEPAKRPAGRIGSGRFDRGDRDDRPRAPTRDGKGVAPQQHHSPQAGPQSHHHHPPSPQPQAPPPHAPQSPQPSPQHGDSKTPRGKGRGRGRGRGRGTSQGGGPGDKSPRPRTWSGGDDRFVECQKEMLVVKFENTAGDNTVEVEYDNEAPLSPATSSKSSGSTPGRGPTGRTPNQAGTSPKPKGNKPSKHEKYPRVKAGSGRIPGRAHQDQFVDADWDSSIQHRHSYDGSKVRTTSHSHSHGDSEEWEDCTESSGAPEEDDGDGNQNLRLDCQLNPEAPEFLPTSPDFLKTPPGHVKVLNWAGSNSPLSPQSNLSQPSFSSTSPRQQDAGSNSNQSPVSSPGSSASTRAKNRREEMDMMPEPDEPLPPPFLLEAEMSGRIGVGQGGVGVVDNGCEGNEEEDEEDDRFEDSMDVVDPEDDGKEESDQLPAKEDVTTDENEEAPTESSLKSVSNDVLVSGTEPQPISNGHLEDEVVSSQPTTESQDTSEEANASQSQSGEKVSETATTVLESVTTNSDLKEEKEISSDPVSVNEESDKTEAIADGSNPVVKNDPDPGTKPDKDPIVISTDTSESNTDSQPTAENSAAS